MTKKIAVLTASWHTDIVDSAENSFIEAMVAKGYTRDQIDVIKVPGALEIPLAGKLALENGYDIAVGIAFVVDGQIYRHEFVGHTVVQSILDVSLATNKPFLSVVLTPQSFNEDLDLYIDMYAKHMVAKGQEAAGACDRMLDVTGEIIKQLKAA
jgi:6,7-dimethyl-8-ribityllumazine synthase